MTLSKVIIAWVIFYVLSSIAVAQEFPTVKKFVAPPYPPAAVAVRVEGDVTVLVEVNSSGKVLTATPISGHKLLRAGARVTSEKWEFTSVPGTHFLTLTFRFRLPSPKVKEFARIRGWYTLEFAARYYRIISEPSYTTEGSDN